MAAAPFDWPSELILSVLELLPLTNLLSMGRVNRNIRNAAEPLVYSTIDTTWALRSTPPAMLVLRSILDRPDLAGHVHKLRFQGDGFENRPQVREPPAFSASPLLVKKATKFIQSTGVRLTESWIDELRVGTVGAVVTTLPASMPNLASLYLGPNFTIKSRLWRGVLRCALCKPRESHLPTFTQLRHVTSEYRAKEWHHHITATQPMSFPSNTSPTLPSPTMRLLTTLLLNLEVLDLPPDLDDYEEWEWDDSFVIDALRSELAGRLLSSRPHLRQITLSIPLGFRDYLANKRCSYKLLAQLRNKSGGLRNEQHGLSYSRH